jgi:DNA replicative helicase MCM subunit Mcm2 (Cdc46/Mcm family)
LHVLTKNNPATATGAHISVIGHITADEVRRYLDRTEIANGLANRFLWLCSKRSKCLPDGGRLSDAELSPLLTRLQNTVAFARNIGQLHRDEDARAAWNKVYPQLSRESPGLFGAITSRAEAQVTRLSCIYALLDLSPTVRAVHLKAALALWSYSEESAKFIFGNSLGDPAADEILRALQQSSLTRTEISSLFGRHASANDIDRALSSLVAAGLIKHVREQTQGRPADRYILL